MKKLQEYRLTDGAHFTMGFYNPSPGNPEIKSFDFDDNYLYAIWNDGDRTKTKIDSIEKVYNDKDEDKEVGIILWFGEENIQLIKIEDETDIGEDTGYDNDSTYE